MARLFDDTFDPSVLGLSFDGASPAKDVTLPERVRLSEFVGRVAVETISRDANGQRVRYLITLRLEPNRLVDRASFPPTVELKITEESPAFSVVSARESSFRGLTFILYARRLAAAEGPELYWHATVDDPEVAKAILVARDLSPLVD